MSRSIRCAVLVFPGSNCDVDLFKAANEYDALQPEYVWHTASSLPGVELILVPGGFSYGDYLRPGALAARSPVLQALCRAAKDGVKILGLCNGFQILTETGLLPGALLPNANRRFVCDTVALEVVNASTVFTSEFTAGQTVHMPVAHGEGNFFCDPDTLTQLEDQNRVVFRYAEGRNPNGSLRNIAGIINREGNVLGMMPHPERAMAGWMGSCDGRSLFRSLLRSCFEILS